MNLQNNPKIETATLKDSRSITNVFINARQGMEYLPSRLHTVAETFEWIQSLIEDTTNTVLKAVLPDNRIVGFCVFNNHEFEHLYVLPELQKHGIGAKLLTAAQNAQPHLELWVFQKNLGAIRFYERYGFKCVERTDGSRNEEKEPDARYVWDKSV